MLIIIKLRMTIPDIQIVGNILTKYGSHKELLETIKHFLILCKRKIFPTKLIKMPKNCKKTNQTQNY